MNTNNEYILNKPLSKKCIYNITPFTLLDFPGKTACILWFAGCNMRCTYCYNPDIVLGKANHSVDEILPFLKKRIGLLDGVVFSGGECLMYENIIDIIREIRNMGFSIKVDTNGSKPKVLQYLIHEKLIDFVSLDFKAPASLFEKITNSSFYNCFIACFQMLNTSTIPFEVRTTVHHDLLQKEDVEEMLALLKSMGYAENFYVQKFRNDVETLGIMGPCSTNFDEIEKLEGISIRS